MGIGGLIAHYGLWLLSYPVWWIAELLLHLTWRNKQEAEYLADYLATTVSGTKPMVEALTRLSCGDYLHAILLRNAIGYNQLGRPILEKFVERVESRPPVELERIRRACLLETARLDATHPPTAYRIAFLEKHEISEAGCNLTKQEIEAIDMELEPYIEPMAKELIYQYVSE